MRLSASCIPIPLLLLLAGSGQIARAAAPRATTAAAPRATAPAAALPSLTLRDLLAQVENRLIDVRRIELRRAEARAELEHLRVSRAFEVEVEGNYREEDVDRTEVNDNNFKQGRSIDIRRGLTFSVTRPLLGRSLEDRLLAASEQQRLAELAESELITRREAVLEVIGLYVDLAAEQRHLPLLERAIDLVGERVRILEARHEQGESLGRDLLQASADMADLRLDTATAARRQAELFAKLAEWVVGEPPGEFLATELAWSRMREPPAGSEDPHAATTGHSPDHGRVSGGAFGSRIWYNLPEIDLTFFYTMGSRDRRFADETDRERGHTPGIELSLEFPLDMWRSGRSFGRQVEARAERQRLAIAVLERRTAGRMRALALAHAEAVARVAAAEANVALREEEHRISGLLAIDREGSTVPPPAMPQATAPAATAAAVQLQSIETEIAVIKSRMGLARAQNDLARRYFERAMIHGLDPMEIALAMGQESPKPTGARQAVIPPAYALDFRN